MEKKENKKYKYYEIKVSIENTDPSVWRRLRVPGGISFHELHTIIQLAFAWCGYHLYSFEIGGSRYRYGTIIDIPRESGYSNKNNAKREPIDRYFEGDQNIVYTYDLGDCWKHDITVEKVVETDTELVDPICIGAEMANLPEDCGGTRGYKELLDILADKENEKYKEKRKWIENSCSTWYDDRTYVNIEEINEKLKDYLDYAYIFLKYI